MNHEEIIQHVHRKLDCLIGSAIRIGVVVSSLAGNICVHSRGKWMCYTRQGLYNSKILPGWLCHPYDLVIQGKPAFNNNIWLESARYLMIPANDAEMAIGAICDGMCGSQVKSYMSVANRNYLDIGIYLRKKYHDRGL